MGSAAPYSGEVGGSGAAFAYVGGKTILSRYFFRHRQRLPGERRWKGKKANKRVYGQRRGIGTVFSYIDEQSKMESAVYPGKTGKRRFFYGAVAFRVWRMTLSNSLEVPEESQKSP